MEPDITERLRTLADYLPYVPDHLREAADLIDSLRETVAILSDPEAMAAIAEAEAEPNAEINLDKLRADYIDAHAGYVAGDDYAPVRDTAAALAAALEAE